MAGEPDVRAWADAVRARLEELGQSQEWLGEQVALNEGRKQPYKQPTIQDWLRTGPPKPRHAFAIEKALTVTVPGSLTRLLGYLPLDAVPALTFDAVVDNDARLSDQAKRMLKRSYSEALK